MAVVLDDLPPLMWHAELGKSLRDMWIGGLHRGVQLHDLRHLRPRRLLVGRYRTPAHAWLDSRRRDRRCPPTLLETAPLALRTGDANERTVVVEGQAGGARTGDERARRQFVATATWSRGGPHE